MPGGASTAVSYLLWFASGVCCPFVLSFSPLIVLFAVGLALAALGLVGPAWLRRGWPGWPAGAGAFALWVADRWAGQDSGPATSWLVAGAALLLVAVITTAARQLWSRSRTAR